MAAHPAGHVRSRPFPSKRGALRAALALLVVVCAGFLHEVHVSTARVALEPDGAWLRVRLFRRDFEQALAVHARQPGFRLAAEPGADSVVTAYLRERLVLRSGELPLALRLVGSGEEKGRKPELDIWWVDLRYDAAEPIGELEITNELLFERYRDQANTMKFRLPSGQEKTVIFVPGEGTYRLRF